MGKIIGHFALALQGFCKVKAPNNCAFLSVAEHSSGDNVVYTWLNSEHSESAIVEYNFYCAFTGEQLPEQVRNVAQYIGTIQRKNGLVVHVFLLEKF